MVKKITLLVAISFLLAGFSQAQLKYQTFSKSSGFYGQGAFESTAATYIRADGNASRRESYMSFTGSIMKYLNQAGVQIEITRLDKKVMWKYDMKGNTVKEIPFSKIKELMDNGKLFQKQPQMKTQKETPREEPVRYTWEKPEIKVNRTGETKSFNGFLGKHAIITIRTIGTNTETGLKDTVTLTYDGWFSPSVEKKMAKELAFQKKLDRELGVDTWSTYGMRMLFQSYKEQFKSLQKEMKKISGYPIMSTLRMEMTSHSSATQTQSENKENEPQIKDVQKALSGLFGRKKKATKPAKPKNPNEIYSITTELKSISTHPLDAKLFEPPKGKQIIKSE